MRQYNGIGFYGAASIMIMVFIGTGMFEGATIVVKIVVTLFVIFGAILDFTIGRPPMEGNEISNKEKQ